MKQLKPEGHRIFAVAPGSIAEELELKPGDLLLSINGQEIHDVFDYHYLTNEEELMLVVYRQDGEEWELEIEKEYEDELGLTFEKDLMDEYRSCRNHCIFCFIDQMPPGMRETLYFKDDDARLSFLQGNYITLTNLNDEEIDRICFYKLSPINISVHTTNPKLRSKMLHNRFAGDVLNKIDKLFQAGIKMNGQIVLCKGHNDKSELDRTIEDLARYIPMLSSVSVVPVGLTRYREGLLPLEPFGSGDAKSVLEQIHAWQAAYLKKHGTRLVHASDEWYIKAGVPIPPEASYEGYPQIENGVGMVRSLTNEFHEALKQEQGDDKPRCFSIATGVLAAPIIEGLAKEANQKFPGIRMKTYPITNDFFGSEITVAGLLTGRDLIAQLKGQVLFDTLLLPSDLLRNGEAVLLDDITVPELENTLQTSIRIVQSDGASLLNAFLYRE